MIESNNDLAKNEPIQTKISTSIEITSAAALHGLIIFSSRELYNYSMQLRSPDLEAFKQTIETLMRYIEPILAYKLAATMLGQFADLAALMVVASGFSLGIYALQLFRLKNESSDQVTSQALELTQIAGIAVGMLGVLFELLDLLFSTYAGTYAGDIPDIMVGSIPLIATYVYEKIHPQQHSVFSTTKQLLMGALNKNFDGVFQHKEPQ